MARLRAISGKNQVPAAHHAIVDAIIESRGAVQGPFTMFLHCPPLAERVMHLGAYVRFEGKLDHRVRVLAAMTVAREFDAVYDAPLFLKALSTESGPAHSYSGLIPASLTTFTQRS